MTKSLTAKGAKDAKEKKSFTAEDAKDAKGTIIRSNPKNAKGMLSEELITALAF